MPGVLTMTNERRIPWRSGVGVLVAASLMLLAGTSSASGSDPLRAAQWGLDQVRAEPAWGVTRGMGSVVAVVDTGVDLSHPDLRGSLRPGKTFLGCGRKGCGNGDWESGPEERGEAARSSHGTHVAGIIGARAGDGFGISGVAPGTKILPVKVLDSRGGSREDIAFGILWAVRAGADVVNLSLGSRRGGQALTLVSPEMRDAVAYARQRGVLVVAAAGNDFQTPLCSSPAFDPGALCVTAVDRREAPAAYSNVSVNQQLQAVAGPGGSILPACGENVLSSVPSDSAGATCGYGTHHAELAGTSMAAPHVAGVAALLSARGLDDDQILDVLLATSRQGAGDVRGVYSANYGWGIVDAQAALAAAKGL